MKLEIFNKLANDAKESNLVENFIQELSKYLENAKEKGEQMNIEFGSQIRSYVMHPYSMVKDHRTSYETSNVTKVLDGDLTPFMEAYLKGAKNESQGNC